MSKTTQDELDPVLREFLQGILKHINRQAIGSVGIIKEAAQENDPAQLVNRLLELEGAVLDRIFTYIDGQSAPSHWPPLGIVNLETGKLLSGSLAVDYAIVEGEFIESTY